MRSEWLIPRSLPESNEMLSCRGPTDGSVGVGGLLILLAGDRIQDPRRSHNDHPGCRLEVNNRPGRALLALLAEDAETIESVPAIPDLDLLPDMGRMTGRLP